MEPSTNMLNAQSVTAIISPKGDVSEMVGLEFLPRVPVDPANIMGENLGEYFKQFFLELPEQAVKAGDKWEITKHDTSAEYGMTTIMTARVEMQFKGIAKKMGMDCAQMAGKVQVDLTQSGKSSGSDISFKGDGKGKIEAFLAIEEGVLVSYKSSQSIDGLITVKGAQNLDGTYSLQSESEYQLSK
jgi:hypothetical protein